MTFSPLRSAAALIAVTALSLLLPGVGAAAAAPEARSNWSLEFKGGRFFPEIDNWSTYYGDNKTSHIAGTLAYKLFRQMEVGIEAGMIKDKGRGFAPTNNIVTGNVEYRLYPASAFLLLRGVFSDRQWLAPYAGGGYTRMFYREKIEGQGKVRGSAGGYYYRAGIQILLDGADRSAANNLFMDFGINHTWLFIEYQRSTADANTITGTTVDLGGKSYLAGLLFEF